MKGAQEVTYYPVFLKVSQKKCVVVGGGRVAMRKVKALLEYGADVEVVSPCLCPELMALAESGAIAAVKREYREGDLKGAFVAIAATDNVDINRRLVAEARRSAVLVNVVDDPGNCDFILPSYLRRGDVTVAVSTGGRSPALARRIRSRLEEEIGEDYALLADLIGEVRSELRQRGIRVEGDDWQKALELDVLLDLLRRGEKEKARETLLGNLKVKQL